MHPEELPVAAAAERLAERLGAPPPTAIVLGSGLGVVLDLVEVRAAAPYGDLGLPQSGVSGHAGRAVAGTLGGAPVVVMSGRIHRYEGHPAPVVVRYVRALHRWGVKRLVLTNAAGGIRDGLDPGTLCLITDHINLQHDNPLIGPAFATRFPDLTAAYDAGIIAELKAAAAEVEIPLEEGTYACLTGPAYETPSEIRYVRRIGGDLVGMSTVPEVLAAAELKFPVAAVALVANLAAGIAAGPLSHEEVTESASAAGSKLAKVLEVFCARSV